MPKFYTHFNSFSSFIVICLISSTIFSIYAMQYRDLSDNLFNNDLHDEMIKISPKKYASKQQLNQIYAAIYNRMDKSHSTYTCQPFYKRIFYNQVNIPQKYKNQTNKNQKHQSSFSINNLKTENPNLDPSQDAINMSIYFNTNTSCPRSYITVQILELKIIKIPCTETLIQFSPVNTSVPGAKQWVHKCLIEFKPEEGKYIYDFKYMIYGQVINDEDILKENLSQEKIQEMKTLARQSESYQVQIYKKDFPMRMIVLGDWAPILVQPYFPIHESLYSFIEKRQKQKASTWGFSNEYRIVALYIAGDIAYNLQDFNGMKYNWFMSELEKISTYWPIIIAPGNHDTYTQNNRKILAQSFELGSLTVINGNYTRAKWIRFPNQFNLVLFDPFWEIYKLGTQNQTDLMMNYLKAAIQEIQEKYPDEFLIVTSHYPVMCSQLDDNHCTGMQKIQSTKQFLNYLTIKPNNGKKSPADFYIGSHMHQYQRVYPYTQGQYQIGENKTYQRGHMVSVVQGVAGCDYGLVTDSFKRQNFSAAATYAKTGYGLMSIQGTIQTKDKTKFILNYKHLGAKPAPQYIQVLDEFTIYSQNPNKPKIQESLSSSSIINEVFEIFFGQKRDEIYNYLSDLQKQLRNESE